MTGVNQRFRDIKPEEIPNLDLAEFPYSALVEVHDIDGAICYHSLQERDPEGVPIVNYRQAAVSALVQLIQTNDIMALVGPSRSGKSEGILIGDTTETGTVIVPAEVTLKGLLNPYFLSADQPDRLAIEEIHAQIAEADKDAPINPRQKIIIFDEFLFNDRGMDLVVALRNEGYKIILCQGGRASNETKEAFIQNLASKQNVVKSIPSVEVSIKPLSQTQFREIVTIIYNDAVATHTQPTNEDIPAINQGIIKINELMSALPIPYHLGIAIAKDLITQQGSILTGTSALWEGAIAHKLNNPQFGNIHTIEELKRNT